MKDNDYYVASLDRYGAMDKKVITYRKKVSVEWVDDETIRFVEPRYHVKEILAVAKIIKDKLANK